MKNIKDNFALYALIIGLLLTFSHTAQAQDVPDGFRSECRQRCRFNRGADGWEDSHRRQVHDAQRRGGNAQSHRPFERRRDG